MSLSKYSGKSIKQNKMTSVKYFVSHLQQKLFKIYRVNGEYCFPNHISFVGFRCRFNKFSVLFVGLLNNHS